MQTQVLTGTILVVEDDEQALRALRALLAAHGFKPICTSSGVEAMSLLEQHADELEQAHGATSSACSFSCRGGGTA